MMETEVDGVALNLVLEQAEKLSAEDKATLTNKLLEGSGLSVVLSGSVIAQINMMGKEELGDVLKAIAERIDSEGK